jgi:hypothetical protein
MRGRCLPSEESGRKEVIDMAIYKIMRIYEVPAESQIEATNRMMEALVLQVEEHWHVTDIIRAPEDPQGKGKAINLVPSRGWIETLVDQIRGR